MFYLASSQQGFSMSSACCSVLEEFTFARLMSGTLSFQEYSDRCLTQDYLYGICLDFNVIAATRECKPGFYSANQ